MDCNKNKIENENEENSSSTNNSLNKIYKNNKTNRLDSPFLNINLNYNSTELKIISNIGNLFIDICDSNSKELKTNKNHRIIKPFITINPSIKIKDYLGLFYKYGNMNISTFILMVIYIDRLCNKHKIKLSYLTIHKLFLSSLIVATKYNEDETYFFKIYAKLGGVTISDLEYLELCFVTSLDFDLYINDELYDKYHNYFADENSDDDDDIEEEEEEKEEKKGKNEIKVNKEIERQKSKG